MLICSSLQRSVVGPRNRCKRTSLRPQSYKLRWRTRWQPITACKLSWRWWRSRSKRPPKSTASSRVCWQKELSWLMPKATWRPPSVRTHKRWNLCRSLCWKSPNPRPPTAAMLRKSHTAGRDQQPSPKARHRTARWTTYDSLISVQWHFIPLCFYEYFWNHSIIFI